MRLGVVKCIFENGSQPKNSKNTLLYVYNVKKRSQKMIYRWMTYLSDTV